MEKKLLDIGTMIEKSKKAQEKFLPGTSQHTLLKNRINSLEVAFSLIKLELSDNSEPPEIDKEYLKNSLAPIESLISKSEKAKAKILPEKWQYAMLSDNIRSLRTALELVKKRIEK